MKLLIFDVLCSSVKLRKKIKVCLGLVLATEKDFMDIVGARFAAFPTLIAFISMKIENIVRVITR
jgi:hypothetical protein